MKKFLEFTDLQGREILVRPEFIHAVLPTMIQIQNADKTATLVEATMLLTGNGQIPVKQTVDQVKEMLAEPDFTA